MEHLAQVYDKNLVQLLTSTPSIAVDCNESATDVIVPILVGAALGLFVVILLLAYAVGRLRQLKKAKSGYRRLS